MYRSRDTVHSFSSRPTIPTNINNRRHSRVESSRWEIRRETAVETFPRSFELRRWQLKVSTRDRNDSTIDSISTRKEGGGCTRVFIEQLSRPFPSDCDNRFGDSGTFSRLRGCNYRKRGYETPRARSLLTATLHKDTSINLALHTRYIPVLANARDVECTGRNVEPQPISFGSDYTIHQFRFQYHRAPNRRLFVSGRYLRGNAASPRPGNWLLLLATAALLSTGNTCVHSSLDSIAQSLISLFLRFFLFFPLLSFSPFPLIFLLPLEQICRSTG